MHPVFPRGLSLAAVLSLLPFGLTLSGCNTSADPSKPASGIDQPVKLSNREPPPNFIKGKMRGQNFEKAWLVKADAAGEDLSNANLAGAQLARANLKGANLTGANLTGANVVSANLESANLSKSRLERANLSSAKLKNADLRGADMAETILLDADLSGAKLGGANLKNASYSKNTRWPAGFDPSRAGAVKPNMPL